MKVEAKYQGSIQPVYAIVWRDDGVVVLLGNNQSSKSVPLDEVEIYISNIKIT